LTSEKYSSGCAGNVIINHDFEVTVHLGG